MIRIGIICPSEIAFRRFLPALKKDKRFEFVGVGIANAKEWYGDGVAFSGEKEKKRIEEEKEKANSFIATMEKGIVFESYQDVVTSSNIDAVYLPLPPALHYRWAKTALENGKHIFIEKPSTISLNDTLDLIQLAKQKNLAVHENYMFVYHKQIEEINDIIREGQIGDVRLYRITFGFPRRAKEDFRYNKALGGGALIDAGGYTLKYASILLGDSAKIAAANLNYLPEFDVDIYGTATMRNDKGVTAQLAFGMDCDYKCDIEVWGSRGTLLSQRILTAPDGYVPKCIIKRNQEYEEITLSSDDAFAKSINVFGDCIYDERKRNEEYAIVKRQSELLDQFNKFVK